MDIRTEAGAAAWREAGTPPIPAVKVGDVTTTVSMLTQLARAVGVAPPPGPPLEQALGDTIAILESWIAHLRGFGWEFIRMPSPSRERSVGELTVNVFAPFELFPAAWESHYLAWHPEDDEQRAHAFESRDALVAWAEAACRRWAELVGVEGSGFADAGVTVGSPRGDLDWAPLLEAQRMHAAFHYRQIVAFAALVGEPCPDGAIDVAELTDLELPVEVF